MLREHGNDDAAEQLEEMVATAVALSEEAEAIATYHEGRAAWIVARNEDIPLRGSGVANMAFEETWAPGAPAERLELAISEAKAASERVGAGNATSLTSDETTTLLSTVGFESGGDDDADSEGSIVSQEPTVSPRRNRPAANGLKGNDKGLKKAAARARTIGAKPRTRGSRGKRGVDDDDDDGDVDDIEGSTGLQEPTVSPRRGRPTAGKGPKRSHKGLKLTAVRPQAGSEQPRARETVDDDPSRKRSRSSSAGGTKRQLRLQHEDYEEDEAVWEGRLVPRGGGFGGSGQLRPRGPSQEGQCLRGSSDPRPAQFGTRHGLARYGQTFRLEARVFLLQARRAGGVGGPCEPDIRRGARNAVRARVRESSGGRPCRLDPGGACGTKPAPTSAACAAPT